MTNANPMLVSCAVPVRRVIRVPVRRGRAGATAATAGALGGEPDPAFARTPLAALGGLAQHERVRAEVGHLVAGAFGVADQPGDQRPAGHAEVRRCRAGRAAGRG